MRSKAMIISVSLALALGLVVGTVLYTTMHKTVTLSIDGEATEVQTFGDDVGDVLDAEGIDLSDRDVVLPSVGSAIDDGTSVSVRYARELTLAVDGDRQSYWVTATSVGAALTQIGTRFAGADLSASRSRYLDTDGLTVAVVTPKKVRVVTADRTRRLVTTEPTVSEVVDSAGIEVDRDDELAPQGERRVTEGMRIVVTSVDTRVRTVTESVSFGTKVRYSDDMYEDETDVVREGQAGKRKLRVREVRADGELRSRKVLSSRLVRASVDRIELHGTQERPEPATPAVPVGDSVWDQLAACESGGDWSINTGNGYYGGLQFALSTWQGYGGGVYAAYPNEASREEQIAIATKVRDASGGYGAWPACSSMLGLPS